MTTNNFRTRTAPSPTGYLHLGTARTVLFTKLFAIANEGIFYFRLEDTDRNRLEPEAAKNLVSALNELGLNADEGVCVYRPEFGKDDFYGVSQTGNYGPYIQSERKLIYQEHVQKMIDQGIAYWNYLSSEEKKELQEIKQATKKPINYYQICLEKFGEQINIDVQTALKDPRKPLLMHKLQRDEIITCFDELLGESKFDLNLEEDYGLLKSDGYPTYHLAHIVDDYLMKTSLVIRSQEWYPSFPKHYTLFMDYLKFVPKYAHIPFVLGEQGNKKMSKRDGNVNMQDYLDQGFLEEAMINYLAFLGWNPGTDKELYL
jgi:nondiscriminating glutamyl-tRNA synthetase